MQIDHAAFFNGYREAFGPLKPNQVAGFEVLGRNMETDPALTDVRLAAYMLATVKHECANTWQPIVERGARDYFNQYETGTAKGKRLGNTQPGDGYQFRGRGYVQITGRANYARMTRELGLGSDEDMVSDPEHALRPAIAYRIMSVGMTRGLFTGKKLSDYISGSNCDYRNARRIINALDQAALIAGYAEKFEQIVKACIVR
jgi:putative chitinase